MAARRGTTLLIGPLPPPADGTSVSFELFTRACASLADGAVDVIDSSPKRLKEDGGRDFGSDLRQAARIVVPFFARLPRVSRVAIFGSNGFLLRMGPALVAGSKLFRRQVTIRVFGGSLDTFFDAQSPLARRLLSRTLRAADGVSVQTSLLFEKWQPFLGERLSLTPGYRATGSSDPGSPQAGHHEAVLRLVYVGHIREEKGIALLLDALRSLTAGERRSIRCTLYGPVYPSFAATFEAGLRSVPEAVHGGVLHPDDVPARLREHDAFVFPSFYRGEGHPGAVVEAMLAGLPVISTAHRSIPELVVDGESGILVLPRDVSGLSGAIRTLQRDPALRQRLAKGSLERSASFEATRVLPGLLRQMGVPLIEDRA